MSDERDFDRMARAWLELGPNEAPDRAVSAVLQAVETTPQVRPVSQRLAWRFPAMTRFPITAAAAVALVIVVVGFLFTRSTQTTPVGGPSSSPSASPSAEASAAIAATPAVPEPIPVTPEAVIAVTKPFTLAFDGQAVWVLTDTGVLVRLDPGSNVAEPAVVLDRSTYYNGISANATGVWATAWEPGLVYHLDPATNEIVAKIPMDHPKGILALDDAVWVANTRAGTVTRIDPATDKVVATIDVGETGPGGPNWLTTGSGSIWVGSPLDAAVIRIDQVTNEVQATIPVTGGTTPCGGLVAGVDALWATSCDNARSVARIDPATNSVAGATYLGGFGFSGALIQDAPWVSVDRSDADGDAIVRIDPQTNQISRTLLPGPDFSGGGDMIVAAGSVWVVDAGNDQLLRLPLSAFQS